MALAACAPDPDGSGRPRSAQQTGRYFPPGCNGPIESCVPVTSWVGPGQAGTHQQDRAAFTQRQPAGSETKISPQASVQRAAEGSAPLVLLLVNQRLAAPLGPRLERYRRDLEAEGFLVEQEWVTVVAGTTPQGIKDRLLARATRGLVGAVLVGDFPTAWYRHANDFDGATVEFPIDLFFMDLDGAWTELGPGLYGAHTGNVAPEVFVGRIQAHNLSAEGTESDLLAGYFDRNHIYRTGGSTLPDVALAYQDDDWTAAGFSNTLAEAYGALTQVLAPAATTAADYGARLDHGWGANEGSTYVHLMAHSYPHGHWFKTSSPDWFYQSHLVANARRTHFFNLFNCSGARHTEANYFGGLYVFGRGQGLGAVGPTKTGAMLVFEDYYQPLATRVTFGDAYRSWFQRRADGGFDDGEKSWYYGMTYLGDPTLRAKGAHHSAMALSTSALSHLADAATGPRRHRVSVRTTTGAPLAFGVTVPPEAASWLTAQTDGTSALELTVDATALPLGTHSASVQVTSPTAGLLRPDQTIAVTVTRVPKVFSVFMPLLQR